MDEVSGARGNGEAKSDVITTKDDAWSESIVEVSERRFIERCEEFCEFLDFLSKVEDGQIGAEHSQRWKKGGEREIVAIAAIEPSGQAAVAAQKKAIEAYLAVLEGCDEHCLSEELVAVFLHRQIPFVSMLSPNFDVVKGVDAKGGGPKPD